MRQLKWFMLCTMIIIALSLMHGQVPDAMLALYHMAEFDFLYRLFELSLFMKLAFSAIGAEKIAGGLILITALGFWVWHKLTKGKKTYVPA